MSTSLRRARSYALVTYRVVMVALVLSLGVLLGRVVHVYAAEEPPEAVHAFACVEVCKAEGKAVDEVFFSKKGTKCTCLPLSADTKKAELKEKTEKIRKELAK